MRACILLLAAGAASRFGSDKRLAPLPDGNWLLRKSAQQALASGLPVLVCLRPGEGEIAQELEKLGAGTLYCPEAHLGMAHTLASGVAQAGNCDGVLVALGDMPDILPSTFSAVANALAPGAICQPLWQGTAGHPVGFSKYFFPQLAALAGDRGARALLTDNPEAVIHLPVDDPGILRDVDRPADLLAEKTTAGEHAPAIPRSP